MLLDPLARRQISRLIRTMVRRGRSKEGGVADLHNKKWWLTPILVLLVLISVLIVLGRGGVAPCIYSRF